MILTATSLEISPELLDEVSSLARAALPEECCGVLVGHRSEEDDSLVTAVTAIRPVANVEEDDRTRGYRMSPEDLLPVHQDAEARGQEVVGYYHSHPRDAAVPSARDLRDAGPGVTYLIVGMDDHRITEHRCWRMHEDGSRFEEETLICRSRS